MAVAADQIERLRAAALAQPGGVERHSGIIKFQCPQCRAEGHDASQDNAGLFPNGKWGCAYTDERTHWDAIGRVLGSSHSGDGRSLDAPTDAPDDAVELHVQRLSGVTAKPVDWVWRGRYARGFLTGICGDGGTGKSTFDVAVTARRTTGRPMPFEPETTAGAPGTCVVLSLEDDAAYTLKPRFIAAGGDPERLIVISSVWNPTTKRRIRQVELERDLERLRDALVTYQAVHFTVSPVSAYLGSTRNSWKDSDVRAIIDPLHDMAASLNISGTLVAHPNKNTQQRLAYRMSRSQAFRNACRLVLMAGFDPEDPTRERRIIVGEKSNISELAPPLAYHMKV
jgi:hypothetical protein